jgi:apolipoprotein N-acyltransferase
VTKLRYAAVLACASALLLVAAFPRADVGWLAYVGLAPLLVALDRRGPAVAAALCLLFGLILAMGLSHPVLAIDGVRLGDFVLLGFILAAPFVLFGVALSAVSRRGIPSWTAVPVFWVCIEFLRGHAGFLSLPWGMLGHTQHAYPLVIQVASVTGVLGVSAILALVNAAVADLWLRRCAAWPSTLAAGIAITSALLFGAARLAAAPGDTEFRVTLIQGNIPQGIKWDRDKVHANVQRHVDLTRRAVDAGPTDLVIWPETTVPAALMRSPEMRGAISGLAREADAPILVGTSTGPKFGGVRLEPVPGGVEGGEAFRIVRSTPYNSAVLVTAEGAVGGEYHKRRLLPFAEYLPYRERLPWPRHMRERAGTLLPGDRPGLFPLAGGGVDRVAGVLICWESIFPDLARDTVKGGADFLVDITNEAWFLDSATPYQFLAMNVFRAVENGVPLVRAANTGISAVIDATGRVVGRVRSGNRQTFVAGFLTHTLPGRGPVTFYTRHGDWFARIVIAVATAMVLWVCRPGSRRGKRGGDDA